MLQQPLMILLKPVFQIRNVLFQVKHARYKLKTIYYFFIIKNLVLRISLKWCKNELPISKFYNITSEPKKNQNYFFHP